MNVKYFARISAYTFILEMKQILLFNFLLKLSRKEKYIHQIENRYAIRLIVHYRFWKIQIHISSMIDVISDPMMEGIVKVINDIWRNKNFRHVIFLPIRPERLS